MCVSKMRICKQLKPRLKSPTSQRLQQSNYIDALQWFPSPSALDRFIVHTTFNSDSDASSIEIHALNPSNPPDLALQSSWKSPSRISCLKVSTTPHKPLIAASTFFGSLHILFPNSIDASLESEVSMPEKALHVGPISCIDLQENGFECVSAGEDGRVNSVSVADSSLNYRQVFDNKGLVSYTAANEHHQPSLPRVGWGLVFNGGISESLVDQLLSSRSIGIKKLTCR